jgi:hypothetical protein
MQITWTMNIMRLPFLLLSILQHQKYTYHHQQFGAWDYTESLLFKFAYPVFENETQYPCCHFQQQ